MSLQTKAEPAISGTWLVYNSSGSTAVNGPVQAYRGKQTIIIALNLLASQRLFVPVINKIESFKKLKANWDGYGAAKIDQKSISAAVLFVSKQFITEELLPFFVGPTRDGGVTVEYKFGNIKIVYRIFAHRKSLVIIRNNAHVISTVDLNRHNEASYLNPSVVYRTVIM